MDNSTYGLSKSDATEVIQLIGNSDGEFPEIRATNRSGSSGKWIWAEINEVRENDHECWIGDKIATVTVKSASKCALIGEEVEVFDPANCNLDLSDEELEGLWIYATWGTVANPSYNPDPESPSYDPNKCCVFQWVAVTRCCP